ncbi:MAG: Gfo/Idh/MocA family oxidoreductase [Calditrichaeota bacterium]|nr:Gfo/Idh/MocA family oxidoreductase [Calditrichota bacterium]
MASKVKTVNYGLIGCGGFGQFCLKAVAQMDGVRIAAVADADGALAEKTAKTFGAAAYPDAESLFANGDIDLVHIVTPPFLHHSQVMAALRHGKHVLCEKPLALSVADAREMIAAAIEKQRILPVDFVLRYNEITDLVKKILDSGIFGKPLYANFINNASDERLAPDHWMWDRSKSGGIFIEHAVHFFDLYRYWFGDGEVLNAHAETRPGTAQTDRVFSQVRHDSGVISTQYHGFNQPDLLDRQRHSIVCETGDITVLGWIPEEMIVKGIGDPDANERLWELLPESADFTISLLSESPKQMRGNGKTIAVDREFRIHFKPAQEKLQLYSGAIQQLITDQIAYIRNAGHRRVIDETNGLEAIKLAEMATILSQNR